MCGWREVQVEAVDHLLQNAGESPAVCRSCVGDEIVTDQDQYLDRLKRPLAQKRDKAECSVTTRQVSLRDRHKADRRRIMNE